MPTYEYRCTKGHSFDTVQSISDEPLTKCEVCGRPVVRVLHSPAVHFKGSGFYNTDYGTKKRQRENQREKASADSSSSERSSSEKSSTSSSDSGDAKAATPKPKAKSAEK